MPVFQDYSENGELLQLRQEPLSVENLNRYIKVHGIERVHGYLYALQGFVTKLDNIIHFRNPGSRIGHVRSPVAVRKDIQKLYHEQVSFLEISNKLIGNLNQTNTPEKPIAAEFVNNKNTSEIDGQLLNVDSLELYIEKHGIEQTKGYVDAVEDIKKQLDDCLVKERFYNSRFGLSFTPNSEQRVRTTVIGLREQHNRFLKLAYLVVDDSDNGNELKTKPNYLTI